MDNIKEWIYLPMPEVLTRVPAEKTGRGSVMNRPSFPPDDPIGQGTFYMYINYKTTPPETKLKKKKNIVCNGEGERWKKSVQIFAPTGGFFKDVCKIKNGIIKIMDRA